MSENDMSRSQESRIQTLEERSVEQVAIGAETLTLVQGMSKSIDENKVDLTMHLDRIETKQDTYRDVQEQTKLRLIPLEEAKARADKRWSNVKTRIIYPLLLVAVLGSLTGIGNAVKIWVE